MGSYFQILQQHFFITGMLQICSIEAFVCKILLTTPKVQRVNKKLFLFLATGFKQPKNLSEFCLVYKWDTGVVL